MVQFCDFRLFSGIEINALFTLYLTIIPRSRVGSESKAYEAEGHEGQRNNCFSKSN